MKDKEIKLEEIKRWSTTCHQLVIDGKISLQDGYNLAMSDINKTSEYKGRGTRSKNLPTLDKAIQGIMKSHRPTFNNLMDSIKSQFTFTFEIKIKEYLEK
jgi:hypothetical protein